MNIPFDLNYFIRDSLLIMLAWFFIAISYFVWGVFFSRLISIKISGNKGIISNIWLGFAFCIFFFSIYHLFLPIDAIASCIFYLPAIIFFFIKKGKKLIPFMKSIGFFKIFVIFLTLFVIANLAIQSPIHMDTGLYHLNSIRWANEYHIIKGLGNLHDRLAFNQLFFLYSASLNFHPLFSDYAFHISNSFLCALLFVGSFFNGLFIDLVILCLFFFIPMPFYWISCPTPDISSTFLQIIIFRYFIEVIFFDTRGKERSCFIAFSAILSALAIMIKLSNVFYALGLGIITLIFSKKYKFENFEKKIIGKAFIFIGFLFVIWITRGYIQSGYPLYPSSIGKLNFKWTVPEKIAKEQRDFIYTSACEIGTIDINSPKLKDFRWLKNWFEVYFFDNNVFSDNLINNIYLLVLFFLFPFTINNFGAGSITLTVLSIICFFIWLLSSIRNKNIFYNSCFLNCLLISNICYMFFWFFNAPDPRFLNGIIIINFIICLLLIKVSFPNLSVRSGIKKAMLFFPFILFIINFNNYYSAGDFYVNKIIVLPKYKMQEFITDSGLKILKPIKYDYNIWDSELPAAPHPLNSLSLLGKSISEGFYINDKK